MLLFLVCCCLCVMCDVVWGRLWLLPLRGAVCGLLLCAVALVFAVCQLCVLFVDVCCWCVSWLIGGCCPLLCMDCLLLLRIGCCL